MAYCNVSTANLVYRECTCNAATSLVSCLLGVSAQYGIDKVNIQGDMDVMPLSL